MRHDTTPKPGSLVVVGTGIRFLSHLTPEAKANIQQADKLLYLVNDPLYQQWLQQSNPSAESLDPLYFSSEFRAENYKIITEYILSKLSHGQLLCVVFYGHPGVFAKPGIDAVKIAREQGWQACLLPAISAEDCLFADLLIDPGNVGCQSYEATDLLIYQRGINPYSHLILWQIDAIGLTTNSSEHNNQAGVHYLTEHLLKYYPASHPITLYEAAQYPGFLPVIIHTVLEKLIETKISPIMSLYIHPLEQQIASAAVVDLLNIVDNSRDGPGLRRKERATKRQDGRFARPKVAP